MNSQKAGLRVGALVFSLVSLAHLWRVIAHVDVRLGQYDVPMWPSVIAVIVSAALSIWLWTLSKK